MATTPWIQGLVASSADGFLSTFANPPISYRPMLRWWWPHGLVDSDELKREIDQMHDAGFGGAEIEDVHHSVEVSMDPAGHGWGTEAWINAVLAASEHAQSKDFSIDIAMGPSYPSGNPDITPDSEGAEKEIATGRVVVTGGEKYQGSVPPPYVEAGKGVNNETLISLHAYRVSDSSSVDAVPVILEEDTLLSLKCKVRDGQFTFTPPDNGTWIVIAFWQRGTGQRPEAGPHTDPLSYVIDYFSTAGMDSQTNFWDDKIFSPELKSVFSKIGGSFFEDSIELEYSTLWTPTLREEFKRRKGYDLFRYLPAVAQEDQKNAFKFSDAELNRGVINDYWDVLGDMYVDNHIGSLKPWAHEHGMKLRAQVYGLPTAATSASGAVDISEGESLGFKNLGDYRTIAGAANMKGQKIMSDEAAAFAASAYTVTWNQVLQTLNPIFTTGNNHQVLHGFSYLEAPEADWPGFAAFTPYHGSIGYAESWGPRTPLWRHASDITGYMTRMQYVLQSGTPKHDVVFFDQKGYIGAGYNSPWWSADGVQQGWSLNIIGAEMFKYDSAFVRDGRLAPDGPGYKVLSFEIDAFARESVMQVHAAKKILEFAKDGLAILAVGDWSSPGFYGWSERNQTDTLKSIFDELLALPNVVNVAERADIAAGVPELPVGPDIQVNGAQIINYHRVDGDRDYYLLVASSPSEFRVSRKVKVYDAEGDIVLLRQSKDAVPVLMDLWTGDVTPIAEYEELSDTEVKVHVHIKAYSSMMIGLVPAKQAPVHAVSSDALSVRRTDSGFYLRANVTGSYSADLSNGKIFETDVSAIPDIQELTGWNLKVQDWQPTSDIKSPETVYTNHTIENIDTLQPWTSYEELQDVSGMGWYTTTFTLGDDWPSRAGAVLEIPPMVGSFRVTLNGERLPPQDQLTGEVDVGPWLKEGDNELEIEVATTLLNRLRVVSPDVYAVATRQDYGLLGPVNLKPYVDVKIDME